jgi:hypothetical protein
MLTVLLATLFVAQDVRPAAPAVLPAIENVRWMLGCWASAAPSDDTHEYWFAAGGDAMVGMARTVKSDRLASYEFTIIRATPAGLAFIAKPSGQPEATFVAREVAGNEVVFSNPAHDFPQRVIYRSDKDGLRARVEGVQNGKARGFDIVYRRIPCP